MAGKNRKASKNARLPRVEPLENRDMFAAMPYGAFPSDTGEFMLGRIAVTPVLLESDGTLDTSTENWNSAHIQEVLDNVRVGMQWWTDVLKTKTDVHDLEWVIDDRYATTPVLTPYEPISRVSNDYRFWVREFLNDVGFNQSGQLETDIKAFNQSQRERLDTDWSFTIFVVNSKADTDGNFASGGSFSRAFAFAGGLFFVTPSTRPASTYTHETGHMFWARDEYPGGGSYVQRRGYYNAQNLNAADNPAPGFVQQPSIMSAGVSLTTAYNNKTSPDSTLAQIGWRDSDNDGIFDVLDVPIDLDGAGFFDNATNNYRFNGSAKVGLLPNINSAGLRNDITLNSIARIEYRFDGGNWVTAQTVGAPTATINLQIPVTPGAQKIEIRAVGNIAGIESVAYSSSVDRPATVNASGISGVAWIDDDRDGVWDKGEKGQSNWLVELVDNQGNLLNLQTRIEPDNFPNGPLSDTTNPKVVLSAIGSDTDGRVGVFNDTVTSTGSKIFYAFSPLSQAWMNTWTDSSREIKATFASSTSQVEIDVIGNGTQSYGRIDAFNSSGEVIARYTTSKLNNGQVETMRVDRPQNDIAYVVIGAHASTSVRLDNFRFGPQSSTRTSSQGQFFFENLPAGTYQIKTTPADMYRATNPTNGLRTVSLTASQPVVDADFTYIYATSAWQNPKLRFDVDNNGTANAIDALVIINDLNRNGARDLDATGQPPTPYLDVNGDSWVNSIDVLQLINYLNTLPGSGGEGEDGSGNNGSGNNSSGGGNNGFGANGSGNNGDSKGDLGGLGNPGEGEGDHEVDWDNASLRFLVNQTPLAESSLSRRGRKSLSLSLQEPSLSLIQSHLTSLNPLIEADEPETDSSQLGLMPHDLVLKDWLSPDR
jgi:hypothetical protein